MSLKWQHELRTEESSPLSSSYNHNGVSEESIILSVPGFEEYMYASQNSVFSSPLLNAFICEINDINSISETLSSTTSITLVGKFSAEGDDNLLEGQKLAVLCDEICNYQLMSSDKWANRPASIAINTMYGLNRPLPASKFVLPHYPKSWLHVYGDEKRKSNISDTLY